MPDRRWLPALGIVMTLIAAALPLTQNAVTLALVVSVAGSAVGGVVFLAATLPRPWPTVFYGLCLCGFVAVYALTGDAAIGFFAAASFMVLRPPRRVHLGMLAVATVVLNGVQVATRSETVLTMLATDAGIVFFAAIGWLLVSERQQRERADALVLQLEQARRSEQQSAVMAERARVARDVHDLLAHTLSGLTIQLEAARMVALDAPVGLQERIDVAQRLARAGLQEARSAVGALRGEPMPIASVRALVEEHRLAAGTPVALSIPEPETPLAPDVAMAVYRVVQESLSNVRKHARQAAASVDITRTDAELRVRVANPSAPATGVGGWGITGMRERAEQVGGLLTAGWFDGEFVVEFICPLE